MLGKPASKPHGVERSIDYSCFGDPHRLVLRQLLAAMRIQAQAKAKEDASRAGHEGAAERHIVCFDIGAGSGAATEYLVAQLQQPPAPSMWEVYGVDVWELGAGYYPASLLEFGHAELASHFSGSAGGSDGDGVATYSQFCANFWEEENVTPARFPDDFFVRKIQYFGVVPSLVYVDCDLHCERMTRLLHTMWDGVSGWGANPNPPILAGARECAGVC